MAFHALFVRDADGDNGDVRDAAVEKWLQSHGEEPDFRVQRLASSAAEKIYRVNRRYLRLRAAIAD